MPVQIKAALPDLTAIAIDVPPVMQPGDTIAPSIKIANYGTVDTATQGPVTVLLVASTDTNFGPTDVIVGRYVINDLPGLSQAPQRSTVLGDVNLDDPPNVVTLRHHHRRSAERHPAHGPGSYFIGVIVDPLNTIRELHEIGSGPAAPPEFGIVGHVAGPAPGGRPERPVARHNHFPIPAFAPLGRR